MLSLMALVTICIGISVIWGARKNVARGKRAERTATSFIGDLAKANVELSGTVEIKGTALAGPEGAFEAPLSKRPALWCRLHHLTYSKGSKNSSGGWVFASMAAHGVPFQLQDESGARARIVPDGCAAPTLMSQVHLARDIPPAGDVFFGDHRVTQPEKLDLRHVRGSDGSTASSVNASNDLYVEEIIAPGCYAYVLGSVRRPETGSAPYREANEAPVIEMFSGSGADAEMILATQDEERLRRDLRWGPYGGYFLVAVGVVLGACNLLWWHI